MKSIENPEASEAPTNPEPKDTSDNPFDPVAFDAAMQEWRGFLREQLLADGFTTTKELMDDIRGR
jgi:hypothetical protein